MEILIPYVNPEDTAKVLTDDDLSEQIKDVKDLYDGLSIKPKIPMVQSINPVFIGWKAQGPTGIWYLEYYYHAMVKEGKLRGLDVAENLPSSVTNMSDEYYATLNYVMPFFLQHDFRYVEDAYQKLLTCQRPTIYGEKFNLDEWYYDSDYAESFGYAYDFDYERIFRIGEYAPAFIKKVA